LNEQSCISMPLYAFLAIGLGTVAILYVAELVQRRGHGLRARRLTLDCQQREDVSLLCAQYPDRLRSPPSLL
jgi:hypothetical protein